MRVVIFISIMGLLWANLIARPVFNIQKGGDISPADMRVMLNAAKNRLYKIGLAKENVNQQIDHLKTRWQIGDNLKNKEWQNVINALNGTYYFATRDLSQGSESYKKIIDYYHIANDKNKEAAAWCELAYHTPIDTANGLDKQLKYFGKAHALYKLANNKIESIRSLEDIGICHFNRGQLDIAEKEMVAVLNSYKAIGYDKLDVTYDMLNDIYRFLGNNYRRLYYQLEAVKWLQSDTGAINKPNTFFAYYSIGVTYYDLGDYGKSLEWFNKTPFFDQQRRPNFSGNYQYLPPMIATLRALGRSAYAIGFIKKCTLIAAPKNDHEWVWIDQAYGDCYLSLKNYAMAGKYYLEMLRLQRLMYKNNAAFSSCYKVLANFYVKSGQFDKARYYILKIDPRSYNAYRPDQIQQLELLHFKADSALGDVSGALRHFQRYTLIKDSLFNLTKSQQIAELNIKYESSQKERSIKLLQSQSLIQKTELQKASLQNKITIGGGVVLLIISGLIYRGYRIKRLSNLKLQNQQIAINEQNVKLNGLVNDKDKLLNEKVWLLKEVHHRVKNNLQIVMSLLSTQSAYLENRVALNAISDSRNRVQAISLIHQKLYSSNNVASINMSAYVADLLNYLADSFDTHSRHIKFEQVIETFNLDIAQAVPLGLILNESVTNAIKYAFGADGGRIVVALQLIRHEHLLLTIADDGKGLPADFDLGRSNTLGMEMMKALSKQLGGEFKVENKSGVSISIEFQIEQMVQRPVDDIPLIQ